MKVGSTKKITKSIEKYSLGGSKIEIKRNLERSLGRPGTILDFERHLGIIVASSWHHLAAILAPSWLQHPTKFDSNVCWKSIVFLNPLLRWISWILTRFGLQKPYQNDASEGILSALLPIRESAILNNTPSTKTRCSIFGKYFSLFWESRHVFLRGF